MPVSETDRVVRVAARGDGVTADGRHAAFAAPGDMLAQDGAVRAGPHHQAPPCRHFPECGGCQLQHLDEFAWSQFLRDRVANALEAQGLAPPVRTPMLSPPRTRRRATLGAERKSGRVLLGFHVENSHALVDIQECWILDPRLFALVSPLRRLLGRLLKGRARVHLTLADQGPDVLVEGIEAEGLEAAEAISAFAEVNGVARFAIDPGHGVEVRWEPQPVTITLGGVPVPLPVASFLQATPEGEAALVAAAREAIGSAGIVADLFAGLGTFALSLPGKVYAGEGARDAIFALKAAGAQVGRAVFAEHRDLFRRPLTTAELDRFDAVVLDPPRAGARDQVAQLAASQVKRVAYISCNPSSFARDAKMLCDAGYHLDWALPVGQFRWSTHVELAAAFSRQG